MVAEANKGQSELPWLPCFGGTWRVPSEGLWLMEICRYILSEDEEWHPPPASGGLERGRNTAEASTVDKRQRRSLEAGPNLPKETANRGMQCPLQCWRP